jgi:hypothetical protein
LQLFKIAQGSDIERVVVRLILGNFKQDRAQERLLDSFFCTLFGVS